MMNIWDIAILAGIAAIVWLSYRRIRKRAEKGCSCCCANCTGTKHCKSASSETEES